MIKKTLLAAAFAAATSNPAQAQSDNAFGIPTEQVTNPAVSVVAAPLPPPARPSTSSTSSSILATASRWWRRWSS